MIAHVRNGKIVALYGDPEDILYRGVLCSKGSSALQFEYDGERILYPLIRVGARGEGKLRRVTWDEALDYIAKKLKEIEQKYGRETILYHTGCEGEPDMMLGRRFFDAAGWPHWAHGGSVCYFTSAMAQVATFGAGNIDFPAGSFDDFENTKLFLIWGFKVKGLGLHPSVSHFIAKGAKCIVIDPRFSDIASKADMWVQIRPNTDLAFALAMINVIVNEGLYDKEFVENWTVGFDKLKEHVQKYTPEWAEKITDVPAKTIREVARMYATNKPAYIGFTVSCHHTQHFQFVRALCILMAITGNIDRKGGQILGHPWPGQIGYYTGKEQYSTTLGIPDIRPKSELGKECPPFAYHTFAESGGLPLPAWMKALREGKFKAVICEGINMVIRDPNYYKIIEAIKNLEFFVVFDVYMNKTAKYADVVLPAATFLERDEIDLQRYYKHGIIRLRRKVVDPPGECKSSFDFWTALARKMDLEKYLPWKDVGELIDWMVKPQGTSYKELLEKGEVRVHPPIPEKAYEKEGFPTPSKKVELYSSLLEMMGVDPLPTWHDKLWEQPTKEYPLILSSYTPTRQHSWTLWPAVLKLEEVLEENRAYLHSSVAAEIGIRDEDWIIIETRHGSAKYRAKVTEFIHPKSVIVSRGEHEQAKIIDLLDPIDPVTTLPAERGIPCRVRRAD
jgi:anaerobic selenocysteine-containing dehydrogenase